MVIFNSYVKLPEGKNRWKIDGQAIEFVGNHWILWKVIGKSAGRVEFI